MGRPRRQATRRVRRCRVIAAAPRAARPGSPRPSSAFSGSDLASSARRWRGSVTLGCRRAYALGGCRTSHLRPVRGRASTAVADLRSGTPKDSPRFALTVVGRPHLREHRRTLPANGSPPASVMSADDDGGALASERDGRRSADAGGGAGHERDSVGGALDLLCGHVTPIRP
jgi:hypothetical protein